MKDIIFGNIFLEFVLTLSFNLGLPSIHPFFLGQESIYGEVREVEPIRPDRTSY